ncbi:unnamed protein product [Paramecium primaurelia]|uniref:Uncharacterized protein n=1 Tax=Paramecium primaurelia TaxID=5886 RepID=A0A8S1NLZ4_PARPR|nr:unnamed protein product [Paramecium primaurelia]
MKMLNYDEVYCRHYRLDSLSNDENRIYNRFVKFPNVNGPIVVLKILINPMQHSILKFVLNLLNNRFIYTN